MKKIRIKKTISSLFLLLFWSLLVTIAVSAQSDKTDEPDKTPVQDISKSVEQPRTKEVAKPDQIYEYIEPQNIYLFMFALKEAGKRGFKLEKLITLPGSDLPQSSKKAVKGAVIAGIVKFDGENRFDYNFFFAEGEENPEKTLNDLGKFGWFFKDVVSVYGGGDSDSTINEDIFANRLRKFPTLGNIYVLERTLDKTEKPPAYKLIKAGVGTGRNPTPKLQGMLDEALTEGFVPVGTYFSFDFKSLLSVDSFCGILLAKQAQTEKFEYKYVRGNQSSGLWKDLEPLTKEGFRIGLMNFNSAVLYREPGKNSPINYVRLISDGKTFQTDLAATLAKNPTFITAGIYSVGMSDLYKNLLIFEQNSSDEAENLDFRFVKINPVIPKQYRKNPVEYLKSLEKPQVIFQKNLNENYTPRDLYYSEDEGLIMLFESRKGNGS